MPIKTEVFNDFQGQILESDVDGIDAKKSFLARAENVILGNGFIENAPAFKSYALPGDIPSKINDEFYELLEMIPFYHSKKGQQVLYILWNEYPLDIADMSDVCSLSAGELTSSSRFVNVKPGDIIFANGLYLTILTITDSSTMTVDDVTSSFTNQQFQFVRLKNRLYFNLNGTEELDADEQNAGLQILEKPYKTNVNFVNDELKINLNCKARYYDLNKEIIFNLSLQYLDEIEYTSTIRRDEGWYLCSRWLGTLQSDKTKIGFVNIYGEGAYTEDFQDDTFIPNFVNEGMTINTIEGMPTRCAYVISDSTISGKTGNFKIQKIKNIKRIEFRLGWRGSSVIIPGDNPYGVYIWIDYYRDDNGIIIPEKKIIHSGMFDQTAIINNRGVVKIDVNWATDSLLSSSLNISVFCPKKYDNTALFSYVAIDDFKIIPNDFTLIAFYSGGQRASLIENLQVSIYGHTNFIVRTSIIDWRISKYEIYALDDTIYKLLSKVLIKNNWTVVGDRVETIVSSLDEEEIDNTLNNNYGLGKTIRVDSQSVIHSEISFKNRVYFVKDDYKVYQSHIAGNGGIQPDSFPYDEDKLFGFFESPRAFHNTGLAVSVVNDLIVYSREGINVYQIEANGLSVFKRLTFVSSEGLTNLNLLVKNIDGQPIMDGSLWANGDGLFIHPGGVTAPKNLILGNFSNYWAEISEYIDSNGFAFYSDSEYWIKVKEEQNEPGIYYTTFAVFELDYNQIRFVKFEGQRIEKLLGYIGNTFYLKAGNTIYTLSDTEYLSSGYIETHLLEYDKYDYNNILQELFITVNKNRTDPGTIALQVILDGYPLITYLFSTDERIPIRLAPISSRFQNIKFILYFPETKFYLSDFGFRYEKSGQRALGMNTDHDQINKAKSGYGYHYGRHYGRNILK